MILVYFVIGMLLLVLLPFLVVAGIGYMVIYCIASIVKAVRK